MEELMKKVDNDTELYYDLLTIIYYDEKGKLEVDIIYQTPEYGDSYMTLQDINDRYVGSLIKVLCENPLHGVVYEYGNYGPEWWQIGLLGGYA